VEKTDKRQTACIMAIVALVYLFHVLAHAFLTDDAHIYFRYADNWAAGLGPVFNPGERVEGYTGFFWLVLLTALRLAGVAPEFSANLIGGAAGLGTLAIVYLALRRLWPRGPNWAWLVGPALLAVNRTSAVWTTGGLETSLFTFLIVASFYRLTRELTDETGRFPWSSALFVLAALTRPDGCLFFGVGVVLRLIGARRFRSWRGLTWALALFLLPLFAHVAFRKAYYREWLPNTFYVKVPGVWLGMGGRYLLTFCIEYGWWLVLLLACWTTLRAASAKWRKAAVPLLVVIPYLFYLGAIGGDHFEFRFLHVAIPFVAVSLGGLVSAVASADRTRSAVALAVVTCLITFCFPRAVSAVLNRCAEGGNDGFCRSPAAAITVHEYQVLFQSSVGIRWEQHRRFYDDQRYQAQRMSAAMAQGLLQPEDRIAFAAVGVVPYQTGLFTIDMLGLTDRELAHREVTGPRRLGHERRATLDYLRRRKVDFIGTLGDSFFIDPAQARRFCEAEPDRIFFWVPFDGLCFLFESAGPALEMIDMINARGFSVHACRGKNEHIFTTNGPRIRIPSKS